MNVSFLERVKDLIPSLVDAFPAIDILYVFGSVALGSASAGSDLDIAVYLDHHGESTDALLDLRIGLWLEERLGCPVDVVVMNGAAPVLRHEVLRKGFRLFERSYPRRAARELRAFKDYLDVRHYQSKRMAKVTHGQ